MAESKKDYRTLFYKNGKLWVKEGQISGRGNPRLMAAYLSSEEDLNSKLIANSHIKRKSVFVSYSEFQDLKAEFESMKLIVNQMREKTALNNVTAAISDAMLQLEKINGLKAISSSSKDNELIFFVSSNNFSSELLHKLAVVEINLARKYQEFSIEVRPMSKDQECDSEKR